MPISGLPNTKSQENQLTLISLPHELIYKITRHLDYFDYHSLSQTNIYFRNLLNDDYFNPKVIVNVNFTLGHADKKSLFSIYRGESYICREKEAKVLVPFTKKLIKEESPCVGNIQYNSVSFRINISKSNTLIVNIYKNMVPYLKRKDRFSSYQEILDGNDRHAIKKKLRHVFVFFPLLRFYNDLGKFQGLVDGIIEPVRHLVVE